MFSNRQTVPTARCRENAAFCADSDWPLTLAAPTHPLQLADPILAAKLSSLAIDLDHEAEQRP